MRRAASSCPAASAAARAAIVSLFRPGTGELAACRSAVVYAGFRGAADDLARVVVLELDTQPSQELGDRSPKLEREAFVVAGHHHPLTSPRAKIEATKFSTSVADSSL